MTGECSNCKDEETSAMMVETNTERVDAAALDVLNAIAEFTEAVALIQAAVLSIDEHTALMKLSIDDHAGLAKWGIDEHIALAKGDIDNHVAAQKGDIDNHVAMQKGGIDTHVTLAKAGFDQHAAAAVTMAIHSNIQTIVNAVLDELRRRGL